jgi:hypothetical protein
LACASRKLALVAAALIAALPVVAPTDGAASSTGGPGERTLVRGSSPAQRSRCNHVAHSPLAYHYPIRPFRRQHPIRGNFGDPRTLTDEAFGTDTARSPGSFTFHNGIDISAATGTRIYPVASGYARIGYGDEVILVTTDDRVFQYFHIRPRIQPGQFVTAGRTVLGRVLPGWHHVHLTEIDGFRVHNPVDPGHLEPYADHTVPIVDDLQFRDAHGEDVDPENLRGRVEIVANAKDMPPIPVPGEWFGFPVTPALVTWTLKRADGKVVVPPTTVVDFRRTEPSNRQFWHVYAAGTYQNFPVFAHHFFFHHSGRYLFDLTPRPLDTTHLENGAYLVTAVAGDACGNRGSASESIRIWNG